MDNRGLSSVTSSIPSSLESVIWDFNGTLIDDLDLVLRCVNGQLARRGLPLLTKASYRSVFGFPVEAYYRRIGLNPDAESMADLSAEFFSAYDAGLMECPLHEGVAELLQRFEKAGVRQFVLSAMEEVRLRAVIRHLGIEGFFEGIYGLAHLEGDSKVSRGQELLRDFDINPKTALVIGDTVHDGEVADALGIHAVLVTSGHQSAPRLRETGRDVCANETMLQSCLAKWLEVQPSSR
jgi:phosphoglycolate phosphatase